MKMEISIKKEFLQHKVGFGSSAKRLGERTDEEIKALALIARQSSSKSLLKLFEKLPSLKELQSEITNKSIASIDSLVTSSNSIPIEGTSKPSETKK